MTCSHTSSSTVQQSMDEVEFERGIWAAARDGEEDRVMELLRKGWDPSSMDSSGYTALHYAARAGHKDVVQVHDQLFILTLKLGQINCPRTVCTI